jgi:hypothetical protein
MASEYRVVTHIHSTSSNDQASVMYPLVSSVAVQVLGSRGESLPWFECQTPETDLEAILDGRLTRRPVDLLFLTDHLSARRHVIADAALALGCRCPRFAVGGEVQTALPDGPGGWLDAPEILLYGTAGAHDWRGGRHYGITQAMLDRLFDECTPTGAPAPDPLRVQAFCAAEGIACALAHPLDGHDLGLPHVLGLIEAFDFVETLNGGYPAESGALLDLLLEARRRANARAVQSGEPAGRLPAALALGGSDAHLDEFDRVVTVFRCDGGRPDAGTFIRAMLSARIDPASRAAFRIEGRGMRNLTLYREVLTLMMRNVRCLRGRIGSTADVLRLMVRGVVEVNTELRHLDAKSRTLRRDLAAWLEANEPSAAPVNMGGVTSKPVVGSRLNL